MPSCPPPPHPSVCHVHDNHKESRQAAPQTPIASLQAPSHRPPPPRGLTAPHFPPQSRREAWPRCHASTPWRRPQPCCVVRSCSHGSSSHADHAFASRVQSAMTDILFYGSTDMAFSPYGDHWRQIRKIVATHLLSFKKVGSYRLAREKEVQHAMVRIREAAARSAAVDLSKLLSSFTTDIVSHAVLGKSFRGGGRNELFRELVETSSMLIGGFNLEDYFPKLARLDVARRMVCARAERIKKKWDDLLDEIINDHAKNTMLDHEIKQGGETDFIDVLLSIQ
uniref:Uncharacterized protein n=1 Tax=Triticum urartu TaxID=4572 RepID=A0A8R7QM84_TRIUA